MEAPVARLAGHTDSVLCAAAPAGGGALVASGGEVDIGGGAMAVLGP